jgi:hypothetical protein
MSSQNKAFFIKKDSPERMIYYKIKETTRKYPVVAGHGVYLWGEGSL